jgi:phytoene synthase
MNPTSQSLASGDDAAEFCADLVRSENFERYATTLFVPPDKRRSLLALYAFNVEISRVRDHISQPLPGEIRLQWWRDLLAGTESGEAEGNPVAAELLRSFSEQGLSREPLVGLIDAHVFDVYDDPMPTLEALESYCHATSSILLSLGTRILATESDEAWHAARHAGVAQGIVDVIRLLPVHAACRQMYLPLSWLQEYDVREEDVFAGVATPGLHSVIERLRAEAASQLDVAIDLLASLPEVSLAAFLPIVPTRRALDGIKPEADPFKTAQPSRLGTLWALWRAARSKTFRS